MTQPVYYDINSKIFVSVSSSLAKSINGLAYVTTVEDDQNLNDIMLELNKMSFSERKKYVEQYNEHKKIMRTCYNQYLYHEMFSHILDDIRTKVSQPVNGIFDTNNNLTEYLNTVLKMILLENVECGKTLDAIISSAVQCSQEEKAPELSLGTVLLYCIEGLKILSNDRNLLDKERVDNMVNIIKEGLKCK